MISITLGMLSVGVLGSLNIRQQFDPTLLLPADSYLRDFLSHHDKLFPNNGWTAYIYTQNFDHADLPSKVVGCLLKSSAFALQKGTAPINEVECRQKSIGAVRSSL